MCGLVGMYSSNFLLKHKDCMSALLFLDTLRGRDSTGIAALRKNADTAIMKSTVPGYDFVDDPRFVNSMKITDFCWIGHNRYGTVGKNIKTNAHPFEVLDQDGACMLVGAHNGTLKNKWELDDHKNYGTDSEALFNQIANSSLEEAIGKVEGAWALTYYDHLQEELRFLRNEERPLFYAFEEGKQTLIWASEIWMIRVAASRAGIKLIDDEVHSFKPDVFYSCEVVLKGKQELIFKKREAVVGKKPVTFFRPTVIEHGGTADAQQEAATQVGPHIQSNLGSGTTTLKHGETQTRTSKLLLGERTPNKVVPIGMYKGYKGEPITWAKLKTVLGDGCVWCENPIALTDVHAWVDVDAPVCKHCLQGSHPDMLYEEIKRNFN